MLLLKRKPKFIYFDVGNVLMHKLIYEGENIAKLLNFDPSQYDEIVKKTINMIGDEAVTGFNQIHTLDDEIRYFDWFNKYLCKYVGIEWTKELGEKITNFHIHQDFELNKNVLKTIKVLYEKYPLGIISNALPSRRYHELKIENIDTFFSQIIISAEVGAMKPSPEIFNIAIKKAGVNPKDILFVDDKIKFLDGANDVGIDNLVLFHNKDVSDKYPMITDIEELLHALN